MDTLTYLQGPGRPRLQTLTVRFNRKHCSDLHKPSWTLQAPVVWPHIFFFEGNNERTLLLGKIIKWRTNMLILKLCFPQGNIFVFKGTRKETHLQTDRQDIKTDISHRTSWTWMKGNGRKSWGDDEADQCVLIQQGWLSAPSGLWAASANIWPPAQHKTQTSTCHLKLAVTCPAFVL